jgi:hypothetical protein
VRLLVTGEDEAVSRAVEVASAVHGEPPFLAG